VTFSETKQQKYYSLFLRRVTSLCSPPFFRQKVVLNQKSFEERSCNRQFEPRFSLSSPAQTKKKVQGNGQARFTSGRRSVFSGNGRNVEWCRRDRTPSAPNLTSPDYNLGSRRRHSRRSAHSKAGSSSAASATSTTPPSATRSSTRPPGPSPP